MNSYAWEPDSYCDPLISASIGGSNRFYVYDGLGSTRQLLNGDQTTTDAYTYEAFGNLMGSTGSTPNPYGYLGMYGAYTEEGTRFLDPRPIHYAPYLGRSLQPVARGASGTSTSAYAGSPATIIIPPMPGLKGPKLDPKKQLFGDPKALRKCLDDAEDRRSDRLQQCDEDLRTCIKTGVDSV